jgi:molybdopterin synthase catalytic subunit/molybdopterin converting factor small subunit
VRIEVRAFGGVADRAGLTVLPVELPEVATVADLRAALAHTYPDVAPLLPRCAVAVDLEVATGELALRGGEEVAVLPPVAGGADDSSDPSGTAGIVTRTGLVHGPIDVAAELATLGDPRVGAVVSFLGLVRDHAEDLEGVVRLEYSAYEEMAARELDVIAADLRAEHPEVRGLVLVHALGPLPVGAHTILIAAAAAHREEAFAACRDGLERVKDRVPVFKREVTADWARWVGLEPDGAA